MIPKVTNDDCRTCGACCGPTYDDETHVDLFDVDVARLSPAYRRTNVAHSGTGLALRTKRTKQSGTVCVALRGTVGRRVSCGIYDRRPDACRCFSPGGAACLEARRALEIQ